LKFFVIPNKIGSYQVLSTFKAYKKNKFFTKIFESYFLVKTVLKNIVPFKRYLKKCHFIFNVQKLLFFKYFKLTFSTGTRFEKYHFLAFSADTKSAKIEEKNSKKVFFWGDLYRSKKFLNT
jgi:hypothetical protein